VLLFEGGESLRFDSVTIAAGANGARRVLAYLGIAGSAEPATGEVLLSRRSTWVRASKSGLLHLEANLGDRVEEGDQLATIFDPFGQRLARLRARHGGIVISHTHLPLVNQGDAIVLADALRSDGWRWRVIRASPRSVSNARSVKRRDERVKKGIAQRSKTPPAPTPA
jgi:hypothetical protein